MADATIPKPKEPIVPTPNAHVLKAVQDVVAAESGEHQPLWSDFSSHQKT